MTLKERAEKAAMNALREPGPHGQLVGSVKPRLVRVAEAIEREARAFAETVFDEAIDSWIKLGPTSGVDDYVQRRAAAIAAAERGGE